MASVSRPLPDGWRDKLIIGLSILLAASPWLFGYADLSVAKWNAVFVAAIVAAGSASLLLWKPYWPDFIAAFMGFWLAGSSRILAFTDHLAPTIIAAIVGIAVIVLALWSAVSRARANYFVTHPNVVGIEPPVQPPAAPRGPRKAA
jgi:hypothetical protein